ncbi:hypothetical protein F5Y07DRAFT_351125 [Xylaria sp. FL0933]|nr:hypothetical protein F5Y07DRAFT_351125 [Xylaria sp. FL0933]
MIFIKPSNLIRLHAITRRQVVASWTAPVRSFLRVDRQPLRSLRLKTTSTKTAGPEATQRNLLRPRYCVYHAGTIKIIFLAWMKLSTLFIFAFFGFVVTPAYYKKEGLSPTVARTALCAIAPLVFVAYITSPFVTFIHVRLPPFARQSAATVQRYLANIPMDAELEITTMSFIAKPRTSVVKLSELRPVNRRFGLVNVARDTAADNAARKWYMFRAVGDFYVPKANSSSSDRGWSLLWNKAMTQRQ